MARRRLALFDDTHGQSHWAQTGFPSRERHTNFSGLAQTLTRLGCKVDSVRPGPFLERLQGASLLVIPPPTGRYAPDQQCWEYVPGTHFLPDEVQATLDFLDRGGRLLAFGYRFGDPFTRTNLNDLFCPLGCSLNNDVVIDLTRLRSNHPLQIEFETGQEALPFAATLEGVSTVHWRCLATFTVLPRAPVLPLAVSPGGRCISFDRGRRRISFQSLPVAVVGRFGRGRFVLVGGPHVFEAGPLGLLPQRDNHRFLQNILAMLLAGEGEEGVPYLPAFDPGGAISELEDCWRDLTQVEDGRGGASTVAFVERVLHESGILHALARPDWWP